MDIVKLSKAIDALFLDVSENRPSEDTWEDAWEATEERLHWLSEAAASMLPEEN